MGTKQSYRCDRCGYEVMTSGGFDYGMLMAVRTMVCLDCRELVDIEVGSSSDYAMDRENFVEKPEPCDDCGKRNLTPWEDERCPRCPGKMKVDPNGDVICWD